MRRASLCMIVLSAGLMTGISAPVFAQYYGPRDAYPGAYDQDMVPIQPRARTAYRPLPPNLYRDPRYADEDAYDVEPAPLPGGREARWGQDRALLDAGHFTGFVNNILEEDMVVQASMGPIVDRTKEYLSATDIAVVRARKMMLEALADFEQGKRPVGSALSDHPVVLPNPIDTVIPAERPWTDATKLVTA